MRNLIFCLFLGLALAGPASAAVDINTADAATLESLPGIGPSKAAAIVQYRTDHGPFKTVDELDNVSGIGPATLASLRDQVTVGKPGAAPAVAPGAPVTAPAAKPAATAGTSATGPSSASSAAPKGASAGATAAGCPVNINKADVGGLQGLPGIGASKAAAILQYRTDHGAFASCDALDSVSGIGPATLAGLHDCCTVK